MNKDEAFGAGSGSVKTAKGGGGGYRGQLDRAAREERRRRWEAEAKYKGAMTGTGEMTQIPLQYSVERRPVNMSRCFRTMTRWIASAATPNCYYRPSGVKSKRVFPLPLLREFGIRRHIKIHSYLYYLLYISYSSPFPKNIYFFFF